MKNIAPLQKIAEFIKGIKISSIPEEVKEEGKNQIFSVLGAVFAGASNPAAQKILRAIKTFSGKPTSTIMLSGEKTNLHYALLANCALSIALDYDDYLFAGHTGHSAVLVPLALAEITAMNGKDLLCCQIMANELEGRLGASCLLGPQNGQLWSFIHTLGAVSIYAKAFGFNLQQIKDAIGIAFYQPNFSLFAGFMGSEAKLLTAAQPVLSGIMSAQLAGNGLKGEEHIFEDERGFWNYFTYIPLEFMMDDFYNVWLTSTLSFKIYPGCAYIDTPVDCAIKIVKDKEIDYKEIEEVRCEGNYLTVKMDKISQKYIKGSSSLPNTLNFSIPYNVASAIINKELTPAQLTPSAISSPKVWKLAEKVKIIHKPYYTHQIIKQMQELFDISSIIKSSNIFKLTLFKEVELKDLFNTLLATNLVELSSTLFSRRKKSGLKNLNPSLFKIPMGAKVIIKTKKGKFSEEREIPEGAVGTPLSQKRDLCIKKFQKEAKSVLSKKDINKITNMILNLENLTNKQLKELINILGK